MTNDILGNVVNCLGVAVLQAEGQGDDSTLKFVGASLPEWFAPCFGSVADICDRSAFVDDFFHGAASDHWSDGKSVGEFSLSGIWEECSDQGGSHFFQARALKTETANLLLIECIDEQHAAEQQWAQHAHEKALQQRRLDKEREKKEILLNCIVHDLSSPLSTVLMNVQHVNRQLDRDDLKTALDRALVQAQRQRSLIHSIADVFSSELSVMDTMLPSEGGGCDVRSTAVEVMDAQKAAALEKRIDVTLFESLEAIDVELTIAGDSKHLVRIFDNLITNAIRHSPAGGSVEIRLIASSENIVRCEVLDEGEGIEGSMQEVIFKPFSQGGGETGQSGLGLYFCKMVVELWGGKIGVEPRANGGACFWFELPLSAEGGTA